jgi:hypothetical protein
MIEKLFQRFNKSPVEKLRFRNLAKREIHDLRLSLLLRHKRYFRAISLINDNPAKRTLLLTENLLPVLALILSLVFLHSSDFPP